MHEVEFVRIKPKSMAVLECLARAAGEVVSRNELFDAVCDVTSFCSWPILLKIRLGA